MQRYHTSISSPPAVSYCCVCCVCVCAEQAGTYNVAGKKPPAGLELHDWLNQWKHCWPRESAGTAQAQEQQQPAHSAGAATAAADGPDIVAVGFQEIVPLSAGNVIAGPSSEGAEAWDYVLAATLNGDEWCVCWVCWVCG